MTISKIVFADTETTGVSANDRVVEVAWVATDLDLNIIETERSLINPGMSIPPGASGVHGITNKMVVDAPIFGDFMSAKAGVFREDGTALVCHNTDFDYQFLAPWCRPSIVRGCTLRLARRYLPDAENHKLQTLRYTLDLDGGDAHSALGDVVVLVNLFRVLCAMTDLDPVSLIAKSYEPVVITKMPFGKHKGLLLKDLPLSYRSWLLGLDNLDLDLRSSLQAL